MDKLWIIHANKTSMSFDLHQIKGEVGTFLLFMFVFAILSCLFLAALWTLLALLYVVFFCFVTFPYVVLGQVWYLIVVIPDLCLLPYFYFVTRGPLFYPFFAQIMGTLSCTPLFFMFENRLLEAPDHAWMRHIT